MYSGRRIAFLRIVSLGAAGASAALTGDGLHPGRAFCPLEEACEKARQSALGNILGVPTSVVGMAAFGALFLLTLLPVESSRRVLRPAGVLAAMVGALLLAWQAFVLASFCPLCLVADAAGLIAGVVVATWPPLPILFSGRRLWGESGRSRLAWSGVAALAILAPLLWPRPEAPSWIELPESAALSTEDPWELEGEDQLMGGEDGGLVGAGADLAGPATAAAAEEPPHGAQAPVEEVLAPPTLRAPDPSHAASPVDAGGAPKAMGAPEVARGSRIAGGPQAPSEGVAPGEPTATGEPTARAGSSPPRRPAPAATPRPDVVIVEYLNAYCAHCRATHRRLEQVVREMGLTVRRHRIYTWSSKSTEYPLWARACAHAETVGLEDRMFEELLSARGESAKDVYAAAQRAGLDVRALQAALADPTPPPRLLRDRRLAASARLQGLPTLDIGRRRLMGDQSQAELRQALTAATAAH